MNGQGLAVGATMPCARWLETRLNRRGEAMMENDENQPIYVISVAARLVRSHPQTLRLYERMGLVRPARNRHGIRLYSNQDIGRVHQIQRLTRAGVNLAGVGMVLELLARIDTIRRDVEEEFERQQAELEEEIARLRRIAARAAK